MTVRWIVAMVAWLALLAPAGAHAPNLHHPALKAVTPPRPALDFSLPTPDGGTVRLADLRGRYVLLNFWATWCPPCVQEMPSLERLSQTFAAAPIVVLAVSQDLEGAAKVQPFLKRFRLTLPVALDADNKVGDAYGAYDLPTTFLIDREGRIVMSAHSGLDWMNPRIVAYLREQFAP